MPSKYFGPLLPRETALENLSFYFDQNTDTVRYISFDSDILQLVLFFIKSVCRY
jgi:hypothetical protein